MATLSQLINRHSGRVIGTLRAEARQLHGRYFGAIETFDGNAEEICQQIVERCWSGDYYKTSLGHFEQFFIRDFGTVAESLCRTGYRQNVLHTIKWALHNYRQSASVTTCIDPRGYCFNAPMHAVDSLPWLLHCVVVSGYELNKAERKFIEHELRKYRKKYLDTTGHVRPIKFAEMRDAVVYDRSAYAISLVGRMAWCVEQLKLGSFPYKLQRYQAELISRYWNGRYFNADRTTDAFSAECALFPFFLGVIEDEEMATATFRYITDKKHDEPFPMIYTKHSKEFKYHWWMTAPFMPEYEGETLWSWHGMFYLHSLRRFNKPEFEEQRERFAKGMIEQHGTFPEMLNPDGSWYYAPIYRGDPGMVWAAIYVDLAQLDHIG
jgi:hypothetical protein